MSLTISAVDVTARLFRDARVGKNLSMNQLAKEVGVEAIDISDIENGKASPKRKQLLKKLSDFFDFDYKAISDCDEIDAKYNLIEHPPHYTFGKYEVIDVIEDWQLPYHLGNAVKYIARAGRKDPDKTEEDIRKAIWYLNRYIQSEIVNKGL